MYQLSIVHNYSLDNSYDHLNIVWLDPEEVRHPRVKGNVLHTHSLGVKVQYNVECVCG